MNRTKQRRNPQFANETLEYRLSPAGVSYPVALSVEIFDPVGEREEEPEDFDVDLPSKPIIIPRIDVIQSDDPSLDLSEVA